MKPLTVRAVATPPPIPVSAGGPPPIPAVRKVVANEPRSAKSVLLLRTVLLFTVVGSAVLIYWSYAKRLQPVTEQQREKTAQMTRIADEIEQLRFKWGPQQVEATRTEYAEAQATLFAGEEETGAWRERVQAEARMRVLEVSETTGDSLPHSALTNEVAIVPVTLELEPMPILVTTNTPYSRVVSFADGMVRIPDKRFELVSLSVEGNSNSVGHATAVVNLFVSTLKKP